MGNNQSEDVTCKQCRLGQVHLFEGCTCAWCGARVCVVNGSDWWMIKVAQYENGPKGKAAQDKP
jgi:hypothetical protein